MGYKVSAYITSYEAPEALLKCISAIQRQSYPVKKILVVENSTTDYISHLPLQNVVVEHHPENIGISGGLQIALSWAIKESYDFLWTFDQDSEAEENSLEILLQDYQAVSEQGKQIGVIAPTVIDEVTHQTLNGLIFNGYRFSQLGDCVEELDSYECDAVITSGSLIELRAAQLISPPRSDLFIDAVDWEYCSQFRRNGFSIIVVKAAILKHRYGQSKTLHNILTRQLITIHNYSPLRYFYISRNHTYVETRLSNSTWRVFLCSLYRMRCLLVHIAKILFYERKDISIKLVACCWGTFDGFLGKLGKTWPPLTLRKH